MTGNDTVVFTEDRNVTISEREIEEPDPDQVRIETECSLVSTGTELTVLSGDYPDGSRWDEAYDLPFVPGYNNVGTVVETGETVDRVSVGDRVGTYGPHAEYVVADAADCRVVPDAVSSREAVFFTIAEIVMRGVRRSELTWGESAVVYGCGLLGQLTARLCRYAGAGPVVAADLSADRLDYLPADVRAIDPSSADVGGVVEELTDGRRADVAFEVTGNPAAIPDEFDALREMGRLVLVSSPHGESTLNFHDAVNAPSRSIIGAHNSSHPPAATPNTPWTQQRHCALFFDLLRDGTLSVEELVSHREPYADAPALYDTLLEDRTRAMGIVLEW